MKCCVPRCSAGIQKSLTSPHVRPPLILDFQDRRRVLQNMYIWILTARSRCCQGLAGVLLAYGRVLAVPSPCQDYCQGPQLGLATCDPARRRVVWLKLTTHMVHQLTKTGLVWISFRFLRNDSSSNFWSITSYAHHFCRPSRALSSMWVTAQGGHIGIGSPLPRIQHRFVNWLLLRLSCWFLTYRGRAYIPVHFRGFQIVTRQAS